MKIQSGVIAFIASTALVVDSRVAASSTGGPSGYAAYRDHSYEQAQQPGDQGQQWYTQNGQQTYGDAQPVQEAEKASDEQPPLPEGWSEHFDPNSGQYYYYNAADGTTTWDRPLPEEPSGEAAAGNFADNGLAENHASEQQSQQPNKEVESQQSWGQPASKEPENPVERVSQQEQGSWRPQGDQQVDKSGVWGQPQQASEPSWKSKPEQQQGVQDGNGPYGRGGTEQEAREPEPKQESWGAQQPAAWGAPKTEPSREQNPKPDALGSTAHNQGPGQTEQVRHTSSWGGPTEEKPSQNEPPQQPRAWDTPKTEPQSNHQEQPQAPHGWGVTKPEEKQPETAWGVPKAVDHRQYQAPQREAPGPKSHPGMSQSNDSPKPEEQRHPYPQAGQQPPQTSQQSGFGPQPGQYQRPPPASQSPPPQHQQPQQSRQSPPYGQYNPYGQPYGQRPGQYGQPGGQGQIGQPMAQSQYGQYGSAQGYSQQTPQQGTGQVVQQSIEEGASAVKEALGKSWQSLVGFGSKTRDAMAQTRDTVVTSATAAGQQLSARGTTIWDQAKSAVGSVFEKNESPGQQQGGYSMSYGAQTAQPGQRPPQGYPQPGQRPQQGYPGRPQGYPPQQPGGYNGGPPRQQGGAPVNPGQYPQQTQQPGQNQGNQPRQFGVRPQPRSDVPYPQSQQGQQRGPMQTQYGGQQGQNQNYPPRQGGPPGQPNRNPYGGPRQGGPGPQQNREQQPRQDPWQHPGLMGDT